MACNHSVDFCVRAGETFFRKFYWGDGTLVTKAITAITQAAPAVVTASGHGLTNNWKAAVVSARGMTQINAQQYPPEIEAYSPVTVIDANQVSLDHINSSDYDAYDSGGFLVYQNPFSLAGATALLTIRNHPESGTALKTLTDGAGITLDDANKVITVEFATAAETWEIGYFDLEITLASGRIVQVADGTIKIT